jgi:hypothetical protein
MILLAPIKRTYLSNLLPEVSVVHRGAACAAESGPGAAGLAMSPLRSLVR